METTTNGDHEPLSPLPQSPTHPPSSRGHRRYESKASTIHERPSLTVPERIQPVTSAQPQRIKPHRKKTYGAWDYYSGPLDPTRHSRLPFWMRLHGSITPKLVIPLVFVGGWATMITVISELVQPLIVNSLLLTVLGFVVGLALSFRVSTANERYAEGRKYWAQIVLHGRMVAHHIWIHVYEREDQEKTDILDKLAAINLVHSFAVAVKDKLRHHVEYTDEELGSVNIENLDAVCMSLRRTEDPEKSGKRVALGQRLKRVGQILGITFMEENPRKVEKKAKLEGRHYGNLPYEILNYLGSYLETSFRTGILNNGPIQGTLYGSLTALMEAYGGCERVSETPLPLAYNISIAQITWIYLIVLPFQLYEALKWLAIPGTIVAAYIILGLAAIARELEDPFGTDVNDLNLEHYCQCLEYDLHVLTRQPRQHPEQFLRNERCKPLYPISPSSYAKWEERSMGDISQYLAMKPDHRYSGFEEAPSPRFKPE